MCVPGLRTIWLWTPFSGFGLWLISFVQHLIVWSVGVEYLAYPASSLPQPCLFARTSQSLLLLGSKLVPASSKMNRYTRYDSTWICSTVQREMINRGHIPEKTIWEDSPTAAVHKSKYNSFVGGTSGSISRMNAQGSGRGGIISGHVRSTDCANSLYLSNGSR